MKSLTTGGSKDWEKHKDLRESERVEPVVLGGPEVEETRSLALVYWVDNRTIF